MSRIKRKAGRYKKSGVAEKPVTHSTRNRDEQQQPVDEFLKRKSSLLKETAPTNVPDAPLEETTLERNPSDVEEEIVVFVSTLSKNEEAFVEEHSAKQTEQEELDDNVPIAQLQKTMRIKRKAPADSKPVKKARKGPSPAKSPKGKDKSESSPPQK